MDTAYHLSLTIFCEILNHCMAWHQANQIWKVINSGEAKGHLGWEPLQGHPWDLHKTDYWCVTVHKNGCIQLRLSKCTKIDNTNVKFQNFSGAKPAPNPILRIDLGTPSKTPPHNPSTIKPLASSLVMAALRSRCGYYSLSLIHIWRCRRSTLCRSRWSPYH